MVGASLHSSVLKRCGSSRVNQDRIALSKTLTRIFDSIPPSQDALLKHIKRALLQARYVWRQSLIRKPILPHLLIRGGGETLHVTSFQSGGYSPTPVMLVHCWFTATAECHAQKNCKCEKLDSDAHLYIGMMEPALIKSEHFSDTPDVPCEDPFITAFHLGKTSNNCR